MIDPCMALTLALALALALTLILMADLPRRGVPPQRHLAVPQWGGSGRTPYIPHAAHPMPHASLFPNGVAQVWGMLGL